MSSEAGTSTFVIRWINFLTMLIAVGIVGFGVWMNSHHDSCRKSLTLPVIGLGAVIFVVSVVGFLGALKNNSILLWIVSLPASLSHLALHYTGGDFALYGLGVFYNSALVFPELFKILLFEENWMFIITNNGSGHNVEGLRYKEYQLQDYSSWFLKQLNNSHNWGQLKSCLVRSDDCNNLSKKYKTLKQYKSAKLSPIEAGCCRPPSECGYPAVNASFYDMSFHPISSNKDCRLYKNSKATKCYSCDSCKSFHSTLPTTKGWSGTIHESRVEGCCNLQHYSLRGPGNSMFSFWSVFNDLLLTLFLEKLLSYLIPFPVFSAHLIAVDDLLCELTFPTSLLAIIVETWTQITDSRDKPIIMAAIRATRVSGGHPADEYQSPFVASFRFFLVVSDLCIARFDYVV
ncbi:hypothetical protein SASPL_140780 [Salvia splendens]|uniref:Tetraspanin-10 n=1 Tax=Salvia splendens TaxID=180675 RepID=A0A8X8WRB3_SALSN|nr:hypothetical protein SASPL_140780 [Salvia splendens]